MIGSQSMRALVLAAMLALGAGPALAQITPVDPNDSIDADLAPLAPQPMQSDDDTAIDGDLAPPADSDVAADGAVAVKTAPAVPAPTYQKGDLIGAAEGVFGQGAEGLAGLIEDILAKQGEPNAYITGQEAGGAIVVGVRYGSGTLHHKVEGDRKVYWTGPSIGFDFGANAAKTFVLVYNLYDSEDLLHKTYPAGEAAAYFVGGLNVSYLRRGDVVLIPVRLGAGVRLGANAGYMKFTNKGKWLPF